MNKFNFKVTVLFIILIASSCNSEKKEKQNKNSTIPFYTEATFSPIWAKPNSKKVENLHRIPSFSLINQDGEIITEKTFENKIYITDFFFTSCPGICPKMTNSMADIQSEFMNDDEILLLSHSVTPEKDSVAVLK